MSLFQFPPVLVAVSKIASVSRPTHCKDFIVSVDTRGMRGETAQAIATPMIGLLGGSNEVTKAQADSSN